MAVKYRALSPMAFRCKFVLETMWGNHQGRMAVGVGVSQSVISHVVVGRQQPGRHLMQQIATGTPNLNAEWLFTGTGEPTLRFPATQPYYDRISLWVHEAVGESLSGDATFPECLDWLQRNGTVEQKTVVTVLVLFGM